MEFKHEATTASGESFETALQQCLQGDEVVL